MSLFAIFFFAASSLAGSQPKIAELLSPEIYARVVKDLEVHQHAVLKEENYQFYSAVLIHAGLDKTRRILTDYQVYQEIVPFVQKAEFNAQSQVLKIQGGIWKFMMSSLIHFTDISPTQKDFEFIGGHFKGMKGKLLFEDQGEKGTLVYMGGGAKLADPHPPALILEQGAEIVFGKTADRMRRYVQENKSNDTKSESTFPQPRTHLPAAHQ